MSAKVRCTSDRIKTIDRTFAADKAVGIFEYISAVGLIIHHLVAVDYSEEPVSAVAYEVEDILVPKKTGETWTGGEQLFYDISLNKFSITTADALDLPAGMAKAAVGTAATEGRAHFIGDRARRPRLAGADR